MSERFAIEYRLSEYDDKSECYAHFNRKIPNGYRIDGKIKEEPAGVMLVLSATIKPVDETEE